MKRRTLWFVMLGAVLAVGGGIAGWQAWRSAQDRELIRRARLVPPTLAREAHRELAERIVTGHRLLQEGSDVRANLVELSRLYHANGFIPEAAQCYQLLMQVDARNARWSHLLATLLAGYGRLDEAAPLWRRVTELAPDYAPAGLRLGDACLKLNEFAAAVAAYETVLELPGEHPHALVGLARVDLHFRRRAAAQERLEAAVAQTDHRIGADLLATVYEDSGQAARAVEIRRRAKSSGSYSDFADPWTDELFADCYDVYRLQVAGGMAEHRGDTAEALHLLRRAQSLAPDDTNTLYQLGMFQLRRGRAAEARGHFQRCTELRPDFPDGWAQLIGVQRQLGDRAAAARTVNTALRHCPRSAGLHLERARQLVDAGGNAEAIADYRESIRLRPEEAPAYIELAQVFFQLGRIDEGVAILHQGLAEEPEQPMILTTLALAAIVRNDEPTAGEWLRRARRQVRVPREQWQQLAEQYAARFGHPPSF